MIHVTLKNGLIMQEFWLVIIASCG